MKYQAVANPNLYHCGNRWVVADEHYKIISEHSTREQAEQEAEKLNNQQENDTMNNLCIRCFSDKWAVCTGTPPEGCKEKAGHIYMGDVLSWHDTHEEASAERDRINTEKEEGTTVEQTITENQAHCKSIANQLELIADGLMYLCPECGELFNGNDSGEDEDHNTICPECGKTLETDYLESYTMLDYFQDCYNIEYRIDSHGEYKSVELMVACGGPNIYVDTKTATVNLYWWGDSAEWHITREAANAIDEAFEELYACAR